ncbi:hypothetical protein MR532_04060 [bacterium]|nr:hypothetical protein [bacterium]
MPSLGVWYGVVWIRMLMPLPGAVPLVYGGWEELRPGRESGGQPAASWRGFQGRTG